MYPYAFDEALARRVNELKDVTVNVTTGLKIPEVVKVDLRREHFLLQDFQLSPLIMHYRLTCYRKCLQKARDFDKSQVLVGSWTLCSDQ
jgi:hypothetical protein